MSTFKDELRRLGADAFEEGGAVQVERSSWPAAVAAAERLGLVIVGMEGSVRDEDGRLTESLDFIADFSDFGAEDGPDSWAAARRVLDAWSSTGDSTDSSAADRPAKRGPDTVEFIFDSE